jgi:hypothetical protein
MQVVRSLLFALALSGTMPTIGHPATAAQQRESFTPVPLSQASNDAQLLWSRLSHGLSSPLYTNFDLFIYVNKAEQGPWAQHLYAFAKPSGQNPDAEMILMMDTAASTGRETMERAKDGQFVSTSTPAGFYELDPQRFEMGHLSRQWQQNMPNSMFFNWENHGVQTGLAIHGVTDAPSTAALGHRASAGCIQVSLDASRQLFDFITGDFEGEVAQFAYDKKKRTISNTGEFARGSDGQIVMADGYRVLVIIEDLESGPVTSQLVTAQPPHPG